ncbi:hypothetical protein HPB49_010745 [Dermacentor silvarum]|uniref:Uncharacterized protein n=1 Tax=Dermacentor silvarum TaxID=543639 RepID=A0ACB8DZ59_DERSI|nr:hypothetical protein HPB49_010745 [Dermacentor silvarum]
MPAHEVFSPPQEPQPFVTTPSFVTAPRYPQPPSGVPFSPMSPQYQAPSLPQMQVTTMPDVSSTLPLFENFHKHSARLWIEEIQRTQQLTSWSPETTHLTAASKSRGTAKNWHLTLGAQFPTWDTWRKAFLDAFADELTLLQWQQQIVPSTFQLSVTSRLCLGKASSNREMSSATDGASEGGISPARHSVRGELQQA